MRQCLRGRESRRQTDRQPHPTQMIIPNVLSNRKCSPEPCPPSRDLRQDTLQMTTHHRKHLRQDTGQMTTHAVEDPRPDSDQMTTHREAERP
jgi:hypothetical protein